MRQQTDDKISLSSALYTLIRQNFNAIPFLPLEAYLHEEFSNEGKNFPKHKIYQIEETRDVSKSIHSHPVEISAEGQTVESHRASRKGVLKLAITDGMEMTVAIDAFGSKQIGIPSVGSKIAVQLPIKRALGIILLSDTNYIYLGGSASCSTQASHQTDEEPFLRPVGEVEEGGKLLPSNGGLQFERNTEKFGTMQNSTSTVSKRSITKLPIPIDPQERRDQQDFSLDTSPQWKTLLEVLQTHVVGKMLVRARISSLIPPFKMTRSEIVLRCELREGNLSTLCYFASGYIEQMIGMSVSQLVDKPQDEIEKAKSRISNYAFSLSKQDTVFNVEYHEKRGLIINSCVNKPM